MSYYSSHTDPTLSALRFALAFATTQADEAYRRHAAAINDLSRAARDHAAARQYHSNIIDHIERAGPCIVPSDFDDLREAEFQLRAAEMRSEDFEERVRREEAESQRAQELEEDAKEELESYLDFVQRRQRERYRSQRGDQAYITEYRTPSARGCQDSRAPLGPEGHENARSRASVTPKTPPGPDRRQYEDHGAQHRETSPSAGPRRSSPPPGWRSHRADTPPPSYPAFDPRTTSNGPSHPPRDPNSEPRGRGRPRSVAHQRQSPRSIPEVAIASWLQAVESMGTSDYADLRVFPEPPSAPCGKSGCRNEELKACKCNLKDVLRGVADKKKLKIWFHPDKFARCAEDVRGKFQRKAQEVFVAL